MNTIYTLHLCPLSSSSFTSCLLPPCRPPSLPNRLRHSRLGRHRALLQRACCTCSLPAVCPYRLDCPSQNLCVRLASAPRLFCQKADAKLSRPGLGQQGGREAHSLTGSKYRRKQRAERVAVAVLHSDFIFEMQENVQGGHQSGYNLNL